MAERKARLTANCWGVGGTVSGVVKEVLEAQKEDFRDWGIPERDIPNLYVVFDRAVRPNNITFFPGAYVHPSKNDAPKIGQRVSIQFDVTDKGEFTGGLKPNEQFPCPWLEHFIRC